jgi:hypothetical protein
MVEQRPFKALVVGSSPTQPRINLIRYRSTATPTLRFKKPWRLSAIGKVQYNVTRSPRLTAFTS